MCCHIYIYFQIDNLITIAVMSTFSVVQGTPRWVRQAWDDAIGREAMRLHRRGELFAGKDKQDKAYDEDTWVCIPS